MTSRYTIEMELRERGPEPVKHVNAIRDVLADATFTELDPQTGFFDIQVNAESHDDAIVKVIDAIAAAGADDHVIIAERA